MRFTAATGNYMAHTDYKGQLRPIVHTQATEVMTVCLLKAMFC